MNERIAVYNIDRTLDVNPADITFRSWNTIIAENIIICNVAET